MSTPRENAPQEASHNNIIVMENNIINYDPNYVGGMIIGGKAQSKNNEKRVQTQKVGSSGAKPKVQNVGVKTTTTAVRSPKSQVTSYNSQTIYGSATSTPQQPQQMQMQKISMPRNVQVVSKTVTNTNNMIVCQPSSRGQPQMHQIIEQQQHPSQSPSSQQFHESNTTQYNPTATTVKTIFMNNNTGNLNLNKSTGNKVNLSPVDYSAEKVRYTTTTRIHASSPSDGGGSGAPQVIDSGKYAFKFTSSSISVGQQQQQQQPGCNNSNANNKTKNFNSCNMKQQQQTPQHQTSYYYQPQQIQYATNETSTQNYKITKSGNVPAKSQQQYVHVQQRLPVSNYVHLQGAEGSGKSNQNRNKYIIQGTGGEVVTTQSAQPIRYTSNKEAAVINYNDVISINNSPSVIQSPIKMRTVVHQIESAHDDPTTCTRIYTVTETTAPQDDVDSTSNYNSTSSGSPYENYMIVNGTKMTDEMSAQILHDFSRGGSGSGGGGGATTKYQTQTQSGEVIQIAHSPSPHTIYSRQQSSGEQQIIWNATQSSQINEPTTLKYYKDRRPSEYQVTYHHHQQPQQPEYPTRLVPQAFGTNCESKITSERIIYQQQQPQQQKEQQRKNSLHVKEQIQTEEEDVIGVEIPPIPILNADGKLNVLHAILQDHTYCSQIQNNITVTDQTAFSPMNPNLESNTVAAAAVLSSMPGAAKFARSSQQLQQHHQQQQQQQQLPQQQLQVQQQQQPQQMHHTIPPQQPTHHLQVPTGSHYDDDAISTISNGSQDHSLRIDLHNDPGESTETANEGEDEDSETRCICDLTHDDGYMICCDNCSKWQHVDCMGIDRANIPEEYLCVNCSPRDVNRQAARTLQLHKRKEQIIPYPLQSVYEGAIGKPGGNVIGGVAGLGSKPMDKKNNTTKPRKNSIAGMKKSKDPNAKRTKRTDVASRTNGKRKELKRMSKKKLKQLEATGHIPTPDKMTSALRNLMDNYEVATTNHYSPELRARLNALSKQQPNLGADALLGELNDANPICTTVPYAGVKILISKQEILPNTTIIEIRGKYMLANQHKPVQSVHGKKPTAGPFLFFYSLPRSGLDLCVDTRTYANEARFVRRSCRPNAEILHTMEKNVIHLYIVAKSKINDSIEITIPHDVNVDPSSRPHASMLCACGVLRDCKFAAALAVTPPMMSHLTPSMLPQGAKSRKNGIHGPEKEKRKYKKRNKDGPPKEKLPKEGRGRGRSTSSSESNTGLLSPSMKNYDDYQRMQPPQIMQPPEPALPTVEYSQLHNEPPSPQQQFYTNHHHHHYRHIDLSLQHPPTFQPIEVILAQHMPNKPETMVSQQQQQPTPPPPPPQQHLQQFHHPAPPPSPQRAITPVLQQMPQQIPTPLVSPPPQPPPVMTPPPQQQMPTTPLKEIPIVLQEQPLSPQPQQQVAQTVIMTSQNIEIETPVVVQHATAVETTQIIPKSPPLTPQKSIKRNKVQRTSVSQDPAPNITDESTSSVPTTPVPPKDDEGKAEKESSTEKRKLTREERKVEAYMKAFEKMEKTQARKQEQKTAKTSPKKPRNSIQKASLVNAQKRKMMSQKRKKRKSKTNSRKSESKHSGESDPATSSEETRPGTSSSTISLPTQYQHHYMTEAELLLSYSQFKNEPETNLSGIPPLISPACMLIESAIDNLEQSSNDNEFKFPKTKPKKSIMNDWLGKQEEEVKQPEYKVNFKPDMNIVAAKVENFLEQNNIRYGDEPLSLVKNEVKAPLTTPPQANSPQTESSSFGSESAVKKRWLRQAISEEATDEANAAQAEFTTPLKKRRVFIEPEGSPEDSQEVDIKVEVKEEPEFQVPHSVTSEVKVEEDATVSSTVDETPALLAVSDVLVETVQTVALECKVVAEIVKEEDDNKKQQQEQQQQQPKEDPEVIIDEDNKSSNSEEMAEYQKVIASFHNENIMMLQTRNKKSKSFSAEPESSKVKLNFDLDVVENQTVVKLNKRLSEDTDVLPPAKSYRTRSPSPEITSCAAESAPILAQTLTAAPETRHVTETIPFGSSRYLNNIRTTDEVPSILSTAPPVIDEIQSYTTFGYRPMMTNLTMGEYPDTTGAGVVAPPPGTYLTSYNKATLITDPKAPIGSTLTGQFATVNTGSPNSFNAVVDQTVSTSPHSSSFLGKSYSTLNDNDRFYGQKIFTKTSSSDPRLNPNLNPPEDVKPSPIPKKKLSLTEYRKRKAQSTDSISNDGFASDSNSVATSDNNNCSTKSCEASPVKNSPSPTNSSEDVAAESTTHLQSSENSAVAATIEPTSLSDSSDTLDLFDSETTTTTTTSTATTTTNLPSKPAIESSTPEVSSSTQVTVQEPQSTTESQSEQSSAGEEK